MENTPEQLNKLAQIFSTDKIITPQEIEAVLTAIISILADNKKGLEKFTVDYQEKLKSTLQNIVKEHNNIVARLENDNETTSRNLLESVEYQINAFNKRTEQLFTEVRSIMPKDGKDADEEYIVEQVMARIKLPEYKEIVLDSPEELATKLNSLGQPWLDAKNIKNLPTPSNATGFGGSRYLSRLADVKITAITDGDVIAWNATNGRFENSAGGGGAWGTITGTLANQTDLQTALDAKVTGNVAITGATKTKITYDAKGLVTAGADATTADIADSSNKRYVTDAQLTVIGNTSGTNTGDQDISGKADKSGALTQFVGNTAWRVFYSDTNGDVTELALGADGTFLKSNGASVAPSFATPGGSGDVSKVGTPVDGQLGVWTGDGTIEGDAALTFDTTTDTLTSVNFAGNLTGNVTGNVSGSSGSTTGNAATVTTNANLTGVVTSVGNATAIADAALSIAKTSGLQTALDGKQATITFGTGVLTALGVNVGSAGAPVLFNGALGTPSSGTVTNLTGTASININGTVGATTPTTIVGTTIQANTGFLPDVDGGAYLGQGTQAFSGLFLDTTATINFDNGNAVITHSSGILTVSTGDLRVTTAGTNTASVVTVGGTQTLTAKTLTTPVINGTITGTGQASAATASVIAMRDANGNSAFVNTLEGYTTTATAAGTTTLTVASNNMQYFTGSTTQTVTMPVASTLVLGQSWWIVNLSTGAVTVNSSGGNAIIILAAGTSAEVTCILTSGTSAASWNAMYVALNVTSAKKLNVSNTITLAGTDGTTMTFPTTSATIARTDAGQTFTGVNTFTSPRVITDLSDTNGNELFKFTATGSAVNELTVANAATAGNPTLTASGGDTNIGLDVVLKGTGFLQVRGNATQAATLALYEDSDDGSNYSAFRGSARAGNIIYTMPTADPTANQVLSAGAPSGGISALSWATAAGGSWALKTSGTATADFTISSLDLDTDQLYKLTIYAYGGSGAATKMTYNNNVTDSYETVANTTWRNGGAATDAAASNRGTDGVYLNRITGGEPQTAIQLFEILISKASGIRPVCHFSYAGMSTATAPTEKTEGVGTLENTTNVTSIEINFSSSPTAVRYWLEKIGTTV